MDTDGVLPDNMQLTNMAPVAVSVFKRRIKCPSANNTVIRSGEEISIYPETSTPGAFIDPNSATITGDMVVQNNIFSVDFMSLNSTGIGGSIFQDIAVDNQGSEIERISEAPTYLNVSNVIDGFCQEEVHLYFKNELNKGIIKDCHLQYIKPPMCDLNGNLMDAVHPFGTGYNSSEASTGSTVVTNSSTQNVIIPNATVQMKRFLIIGDMLPNDAQTVSGFYNLPFINTQANTLANSGTFYNITPATTTPMDWPDFYDPNLSTPIIDSYVRTFGSVNKVQVAANLCNVKFIPVGMDIQNDCYANGGVLGNPNVVSNVYLDENDGSAAVTLKPLVQKEVTIRFSARLPGGILGYWNNKMVPSSLLGPKQLCLRIKLAFPYHAFKLSFDPCRVMAGTIRDRIRNIGTKYGQRYGLNTFTFTDNAISNPYNPLTTSYAPGFNPSYSIPLNFTENTANNLDVAPVNAVFNDAACTGECLTVANNFFIAGAIVKLVARSGATPPKIKIADSGNSATIAKIKVGMSFKFGTTTSAFGKISGAGVDDTTDTMWEVEELDEHAAISTAETCAFYLDSSTYVPLPAACQYELVTAPWTFKRMNKQYANNDSIVRYCQENQVLYGTRELQSRPQSKRMFQFSTVTGQEYSTFTATSGPHVYVGNGFDYYVTNVYYCIDQYILPDSLMVPLIQEAAQRGFVTETKTVRTYQVAINQGAQIQSLIIPAKVAKAQSMTCVFQNMEQRNLSTGFLYDSNCGYNIFSSLTRQANSYNIQKDGWSAGVAKTIFGVGLDRPLIYTPSEMAKSTISVQLKIGQNNFPQDKITNMNDLITYTSQSIHNWSDVEVKSELSGLISTSYGAGSTGSGIFTSSSKNFTGGKIENKLVYDCLTANKYTTTFIDQHYLDDQTITENPSMGLMRADFGNVSDASAAKGTKANGMNSICPRGFCLNHIYEVPDGKFFLNFDLTTVDQRYGLTSGIYLGNSTITLELDGARAFVEGKWRMLVFVQCLAKVNYAGMGQIIVNY